jgi:integrase
MAGGSVVSAELRVSVRYTTACTLIVSHLKGNRAGHTGRRSAALRPVESSNRNDCTFASHLIRQGIDPVRASRQLGHARPSSTLDIYAHEFEEARGHTDISGKLAAAFGGLVSPSDQI